VAQIPTEVPVSNPAGYPSPDKLEIPSRGARRPQARFYEAYLVQFNRLWVTLAVLLFTNVITLIGWAVSSAKFRPSTEFVTMKGGFPVAYNNKAQLLVDDVEYSRERMVFVLNEFVQNRYAYDFEKPYKFLSALRYVAEEYQATERKKLADLKINTTIVESRTRVALEPDFGAMDVTARGKGVFDIVLVAKMRLNDAAQYPDPTSPLVKNVRFEMTVKTAAITSAAPWGYVIISTSRDIL
jgi:hypothetical protein